MSCSSRAVWLPDRRRDVRPLNHSSEVFGQPGGGGFRGVKKYGDSPGFCPPSGTVIGREAPAPQDQTHRASYLSSNVTVNWFIQYNSGPPRFDNRELRVSDYHLVNKPPQPPHKIHPLTQAGPFSVRSGFHPIPDFKTKNAQDAFQNYEGARSKITPKTDTTQIRLSQATYNYVCVERRILRASSQRGRSCPVNGRSGDTGWTIQPPLPV